MPKRKWEKANEPTWKTQHNQREDERSKVHSRATWTWVPATGSFTARENDTHDNDSAQWLKKTIENTPRTPNIYMVGTCGGKKSDGGPSLNRKLKTYSLPQ